MPVKVLIPTPLRPYAEKKDCIQFDARTVGEALDLLTAQHRELRKHLFADDGRLRSFVNVYVNDEDIRHLQKERTPLRDGDLISIIPSIAGGCTAGTCGVRSADSGGVHRIPETGERSPTILPAPWSAAACRHPAASVAPDWLRSEVCKLKCMIGAAP